MAARRPSASDFGAHAPSCLGIRPLLCRHHSCELEISIYPADHFLDSYYIMFDCGGMAFSEAGFHASAAIFKVKAFNRRSHSPIKEERPM